MLPRGRIEQLRGAGAVRGGRALAPRPLNGGHFFILCNSSGLPVQPRAVGSMRTPSFFYFYFAKGERPVTGRGSTHSAPSPATGRARVAQYPRTATSAERRASPARAAAVNTR
ncbi:hypothetical protein EVAR_100682_1 [Eumeta japonica]|uniref:Uncharacterized protein n=1 Tax=Eumeta variegata TaxID=151549 RepID=A0A4C1ZUA5_EUMVA|nr:hypothetical protein EVAR_100682_1 [Eumeta japonica]